MRIYKMEFKKIIAGVLLLLFVVGMIVPAALAAEDTSALKTKVDAAELEVIKAEGDYFNALSDLQNGKDAKTVKTNLGKVKIVYDAQLKVLKDVRAELEKMQADGKDIGQAGSDLLTKVSDGIVLMNKMMAELTYATLAADARLVLAGSWNTLTGGSIEPVNAAIGPGDVAALKKHLPILAKDGEVLVKALKHAQEVSMNIPPGTDIIEPLDQIYMDGPTSLLFEIEAAFAINPGTTVDTVLDIPAVGYGYAVLAVTDTTSMNGFEFVYKKNKADFDAYKADLNKELCAKKDGQKEKLALVALASVVQVNEKAADKFENLLKIGFSGNPKFDDYVKRNADYEKKFADLAADIVKTANEATCVSGSSGSSGSGSTTTPKTLEGKYEALDSKYETAKDDYYDYKKDYEKAVVEDDSKDKKDAEEELEDLEEDVDGFIKDVRSLEKDVKKDTTLTSSEKKSLLKKLEDLEEDLESLDDKIENVLDGKTVSASSVSSSSSNFVPAPTTSKPAEVSKPVETINLFPTGTVGAQPIQEDNFVEMALLIGGVVIVGLLILFLLGIVILRK